MENENKNLPEENKLSGAFLKIFYVIVLLGALFGVYTFIIDKYTVYSVNEEIILNEGSIGQFDLLPKESSYYDLDNYRFKSSDEKIAYIDAFGLIQGIKKGTTTVKARYKYGIFSKKMKVKVEKIEVSSIKLPDKIDLDRNSTYKVKPVINNDEKITANLTYVSSDDDVLKVDALGNITGLREGTAKLTVLADNDVKSETNVNITVSKSPIEEIRFVENTVKLNLDEEAELALSIYPSNASTLEVAFSSSNSDVISVDEFGNITAEKEGFAVITAKTKEGLEANCIVVSGNKKDYTEEEKVVVSENNIVMYVGEEREIFKQIVPPTSSDKKTYLVSDNSDIVSVSTGLLVGKKAGTTQVVVKTDNDNVKEVIKVTVKDIKTEVDKITINNENNITLYVGDEINLSASVSPESSTSKKITWTSSDESAAKITKTGRLIGLKRGNAKIVATSHNGKTDTINVIIRSTDNDLLKKISGAAVNGLEEDDEDTYTGISTDDDADDEDADISSIEKTNTVAVKSNSSSTDIYKSLVSKSINTSLKGNIYNVDVSDFKGILDKFNNDAEARKSIIGCISKSGDNYSVSDFKKCYAKPSYVSDREYKALLSYVNLIYDVRYFNYKAGNTKKHKEILSINRNADSIYNVLKFNKSSYKSVLNIINNSCSDGFNGTNKCTEKDNKAKLAGKKGFSKTYAQDFNSRMTKLYTLYIIAKKHKISDDDNQYLKAIVQELRSTFWLDTWLEAGGSKISYLGPIQFAHGIIMGYDAAYGSLKSNERSNIENALIKNIIMPSMDYSRSKAWDKNGNWNQTCNSVGALTVLVLYSHNVDDNSFNLKVKKSGKNYVVTGPSKFQTGNTISEPRFTNLINNKINTSNSTGEIAISFKKWVSLFVTNALQEMIGQFKNTTSSSSIHFEGYTYYDFGTEYIQTLIASVEKAYGINVYKFLNNSVVNNKIARYLLYFLYLNSSNDYTTYGYAFSYSDSSAKGKIKVLPLYMAQSLHDNTKNDKELNIAKSLYSLLDEIELWNYNNMLYYKNRYASDTPDYEAIYGPNGIINSNYNTGYEKKDAGVVALHGYNKDYKSAIMMSGLDTYIHHRQLDIGSYSYTALGVPWIHAIGNQGGYASNYAGTPGRFFYASGYYHARAESHSTLVIGSDSYDLVTSTYYNKEGKAQGKYKYVAADQYLYADVKFNSYYNNKYYGLTQLDMSNAYNVKKYSFSSGSANYNYNKIARNNIMYEEYGNSSLKSLAVKHNDNKVIRNIFIDNKNDIVKITDSLDLSSEKKDAVYSFVNVDETVAKYIAFYSDSPAKDGVKPVGSVNSKKVGENDTASKVFKPAYADNKEYSSDVQTTLSNGNAAIQSGSYVILKTSSSNSKGLLLYVEDGLKFELKKDFLNKNLTGATISTSKENSKADDKAKLTDLRYDVKLMIRKVDKENKIKSFKYSYYLIPFVNAADMKAKINSITNLTCKPSIANNKISWKCPKNVTAALVAGNDTNGTYSQTAKDIDLASGKKYFLLVKNGDKIVSTYSLN